MKCTVCNHPRSHDIDLAILSGNYSLSELKQLFGPSRSALWRHKNHLQDKISRGQTLLEHTIRQAYLFKLNALFEEAADTVRTSREEGNSRLRLQSINTSARLIQAMDKMAVPLDQSTVYRLLTSPRGPQSDCFLPVDSHILADNFRALVLGLLFPCPEAEPRQLLDPEDMENELPDCGTLEDGLKDCQGQGEEWRGRENAVEAAGGDDLAAAPESAPPPSPAQSPELAAFLAPAAPLPDSPAASPSPPVPETAARRQRDKSATEAVPTAPRAQEISPIQSVIQDSPEFASSPAPSPTPDPCLSPPPEPSCSPEDIAVPSQTSDPAPLTAAPCLADRCAGYFKFPGDYPPGYLHAMTHGYWPDNPPEYIPDRRWEEDFGSGGRFGKTRGTY